MDNKIPKQNLIFVNWSTNLKANLPYTNHQGRDFFIFINVMECLSNSHHVSQMGQQQQQQWKKRIQSSVRQREGVSKCKQIPTQV